jgi:hypothetical protein
VIRKSHLVSLGYFVLLYTFLTLPWPGWNEAYSTFFRGVSAWAYAGDNGRRSLSFEPLNDPEHPYYTRVVIVNRTLMSRGGGGPIWNLDLDTIGFGWKPTALLIALTLATPISFKRRCRALIFGLLSEQAVILWTLGYFIWLESAGVSLVTFTPFGKEIAENIAHELRMQLGFVPPIIIWILVSFNRGDARLLVSAPKPKGNR